MSGDIPKTEPAETSADVLERMGRLHPKLIDLSLGRVRRLLADLGRPERRLPPVIHVAGTNGKGSVAAFIKAMLEAGGLAAHAYTSPHLVRFHERICLAGRPKGEAIPENALVDLLTKVETANAGKPITYFEITTAAALAAFADRPADALILEVGMGGRLDTTNVVDDPAVTVITPVSYDHQAFLGDTLEEIAREKAGILKSGAPAIIGPQQPEALNVIERRAAELGAPLLVFGQDFRAYEEHGRLVYEDLDGLLDLPLPRLLGRHQLDNAATAIAAVRAFSAKIEGDAIAEGLLTVRWPGRLQRLKDGPLLEIAPDGAELWLDGGHNAAAAEAVSSALADLEDKAPHPLYLIIGMLKTKDPGSYLRHFEGLARRVVTVGLGPEHEGHEPGALYDAARDAGLEAEPAESLSDAVARIAAVSELDDVEPPRILIAGSLYLAGEVLSAHQ